MAYMLRGSSCVDVSTQERLWMTQSQGRFDRLQTRMRPRTYERSLPSLRITEINLCTVETPLRDAHFCAQCSSKDASSDSTTATLLAGLEFIFGGETATRSKMS